MLQWPVETLVKLQQSMFLRDNATFKTLVTMSVRLSYLASR